MRLLPALTLLALGTLPQLASARPITAGVNLGLSHSKQDASIDEGPSHTLGLFGRLGLTRMLSGQLELAEIAGDYDGAPKVRTATALLVLDIVSRGRFVPTLAVGAGVAEEVGTYGSKGHHFEGGVGLEYRAEGGLTIGLDLRMGGRSIDNEDQILPVATGVTREGTALYIAPGGLQAGEYRSGRITAAIRF